jgi:hypothetical protein
LLTECVSKVEARVGDIAKAKGGVLLEAAAQQTPNRFGRGAG